MRRSQSIQSRIFNRSAASAIYPRVIDRCVRIGLVNFYVAIVVSTSTKSGKVITYSPQTTTRAELALRCAPFNLSLFAQLRWASVSVPQLAGTQGLNAGYTHRALSELDVESATNWLITVGMLRREVDGQGLTDSFRLTPLGLNLVEKWEVSGGKLPSVNVFDRLTNFSTRWFRLPI